MDKRIQNLDIPFFPNSHHVIPIEYIMKSLDPIFQHPALWFMQSQNYFPITILYKIVFPNFDIFTIAISPSLFIDLKVCLGFTKPAYWRSFFVPTYIFYPKDVGALKKILDEC